MNPQKLQGHGICGSRNIYSSKVRIDNWVEDNIAVDLLAHERGPKLSYTTVTKTQHIDPKDMPAQPPLPAKMPSTHELKTKNKEGLAYELLFEHGTNLTKQTSQDRFQTVTGLTIMSRPDLPRSLSPSRELLKSKSRAMMADISQALHMSTEYRSANAHLKFNPKTDGKPTEATLRRADIPNFHRRSLISNS
eukprot:gene39796-48453_t